MTKRELHQKDKIISPLIEQGQSPYQILTNHPELDMSVRSIYNYIDLGLTSFVEMDTVHSSRESKKNLLTMFSHSKNCSLLFS